jgi:predicted phage tail protein
VREVILGGELGRRYGRRHLLDVKSPAEAIQALCANFRCFEKRLLDSDRNGVGFHVFSGVENVGESQLRQQGSGALRFVPVVRGSKQGGVFQIIAGVVLVIVGVVLDALGYEFGTVLIKVGAALIIGGIVQMLVPQQQKKKDGQNTASSGFGGAVNVTAQGAPVPIFYGEGIIGSAVISGGIAVADINIDAGDNDTTPVIDLDDGP